MDFPYLLIAFDSGTVAMALRQELERSGVAFAVMPTPKSLVKSCGLSIRFDERDLALVQKAIDMVADSPSQYAFFKAIGNQRKPAFIALEI